MTKKTSPKPSVDWLWQSLLTLFSWLNQKKEEQWQEAV